jgi:1-acyl-sn-glycerol-3-phosphate acyltransferase
MPIKKESGNRAFSYVCRHMVRLIFSWSCRIRRLRKTQAYPSGSFIVVANHISHFDPPMLASWFPRYIDWMAMEELYSNRWSAWLLRSLCAFPVKRSGGDFASLRAALGRLKIGRVVGIFPEGGIRAGPGSILESAPVWVGFAGLSILSNKPVVPCVIVGTDRLYRPKNWLPFRRVPVWMGFGEPIKPRTDIPREQAQAILVEEVKRSLLALKDELVQHYGLHPDDLPQTPQYRKRENFVPLDRKRGSAS